MATEVEQKAEEAKQVLNNPVFKEAFFGLQVGVIDEIGATDPGDRDRLANLALKLQVISEYEAELIQRIDDHMLDKMEGEFQQPSLQ